MDSVAMTSVRSDLASSRGQWQIRRNHQIEARKDCDRSILCQEWNFIGARYEDCSFLTNVESVHLCAIAICAALTPDEIGAKLQNLFVERFGVTGFLILVVISLSVRNDCLRQRVTVADDRSRAVDERVKIVEERDALSQEKSAAIGDLLGMMKRAGLIVKFPSAPHTRDSAFRILLVEDEKAIHYYKEPIEEEFPGAQVHLASDGNEAWAKVKFSRPSLVITDLLMPGMDGFKLISQLRDYYPDVPVLAISAYVDHEYEIIDRIGSLPSNFKFVSKPVSLTSLLCAMRDMLIDQRKDGHRESVAI